MKYSICLFFLLLFSISVRSQNDDLRTEIDKLIRFDTDINFKKTPGFIIGIIDNDSNYIYSFGSKIKKEKVDIQKDDIFEVGSVTKAFTASLVSILVYEGLMTTSDLVNNFLPKEYQNPRLENLKVIDLITHTSGLPKRPSFFGKKEKNFQNPYEFYQNADLLSFYRDFIPGKISYEYSHTNFALLELIIEKVTGKQYADVMADKLFLPLNMDNSFVDFPEKKQGLISPGYDRSEKAVSPWTFKSFKASEGIKTTIFDMLLFIKANLGCSKTKYDTIFNNNFIPLVSSSFNDHLSMAMGWHTIDMKKFHIITHTGKTSGHNAFVGFVRETKTAVVIFSNSSIGAEDLGVQVLRMINFNWKRVNI
ncbi:MAG: serine hydrolase [Saprospiraceae bacterium]|nr:serine hydrolase [Saprospiraceae bacterium]